MHAAELRAEFPVLERFAYLNAGTAGPIPRRAVAAASERVALELARGRTGRDHWESHDRARAELRSRLAALLGCQPAEVALTRSTTDGMNIVLSGLDLRAGDEVLTTAEEHPGLLAPLAAARRRLGIEVRFAPFAGIAGEVGPGTRLVACSHVSWVTGQVVDAATLAVAGSPVLLDGAQGLGAVPVDVRALGCDFYGASGQKWLCGPDGSGCLFVRADRTAELAPAWAGYESLADPGQAFDFAPKPGARRFDRGSGSGPLAAWSLASLDVLAETGWPSVLERGPALAARLAERLAGRGVEVASRGGSTLVSWRDSDAAGTVNRLAEAGVVVRDIPGHGLVRASIGAWSSEEDVERLVSLAA